MENETFAKGVYAVKEKTIEIKDKAIEKTSEIKEESSKKIDEIHKERSISKGDSSDFSGRLFFQYLNENFS